MELSMQGPRRIPIDVVWLLWSNNSIHLADTKSINARRVQRTEYAEDTDMFRGYFKFNEKFYIKRGISDTHFERLSFSSGEARVKGQKCGENFLGLIVWIRHNTTEQRE